MAASPLKPVAVAIAVCVAFAAAHGAEKPACREPIDLKMESYEVDFRSGKTLMRKVAISQCDVSITANRAEATGLDFKDSRWVFSGDVHINAEQRGDMRSEKAEVDFHNNLIAKATIKGSPAQFEQKYADSNQTARGRAGQIVYDVGAGSVRFTEDAWLTNGENEISGPLLVYNIRQQKVQGERVRITIVPKKAVEKQ
jgi:lipopolysaccharide transport protein LptA